jgi:predicted nucleotidyltransferase
MTRRFGLEENDIQAINKVFSRYPQVEKAVLYGSRAKGNYKNGSDIDLTLHGGEDLTLNVLFRIMDEIDDLLLPYTFDLSIFRHISDPDVIEHIQRVGVTFYMKYETFGGDSEENEI